MQEKAHLHTNLWSTMGENASLNFIFVIVVQWWMVNFSEFLLIVTIELVKYLRDNCKYATENLCLVRNEQ